MVTAIELECELPLKVSLPISFYNDYHWCRGYMVHELESGDYLDSANSGKYSKQHLRSDT